MKSRVFVNTVADAVVIPESVVSIADDAFDGSLISIIYGFEDSVAEIFTVAHPNMCFIPIDQEWLANH